MSIPKRIYLVGMPASGKTTLGKKLAKALGYPFIDLDWEIERKANMGIPTIFKEKGEDYFRLLEREAVREITPSPAIIATGGGAPCFHQNMDWIIRLGYTIFIDVPVDELAKRALRKAGSRPLLKQNSIDGLIEELNIKREQRLPFYQQAHYCLQYKDIASFLESQEWKSIVHTKP